MKIKQVEATNFQDYHKTSMLIATAFCDGKCWRERGLEKSDCHNEALLSAPTLEVDAEEIIEDYLNNPLTEAIIFGGLEPMLQFDEVLDFIKLLRNKYHCDDDIVIYTGYNEEEIAAKIEQLRPFKNIIVKFGRYIPGQQKVWDDVLGIYLVSPNQHAVNVGQ